jgi:ATP-dependent DNA helicase RecG
MPEHQSIEWKESWRDEYLRWICGFANANGGTLVIGKSNDGIALGVKDSGKLLEEIPNKARDILGILVDVNLRYEQAAELVEIVVEPYPYPISYKGEYHYRSGSTKQELKGAALDRFLLRKQGRHWDGVPVPNVEASELDPFSLAAFRKRAHRSKRLTPEILREPDAALLEKLHLMEGHYLKRAAILLFHPDPERFVTGAFIKIGFFRTDADLVFHDEIHGDLFSQVDKTLDTLRAKYLKALISYDGVQRVENYPVPEEALREAILNAVAHKDYSSGSPIQISVYADKLLVWNSGHLPHDWTVDRLTEKHSSQPFNPDIANAFFRAGAIESWGRGIERIMSACRESGTPRPTIDYEPGGIWIKFPFSTTYLAQVSNGPDAKKSSGKSSGKTEDKIIAIARKSPSVSIPQIAEILGISTRAVEKQIRHLKQTNRLRRIGPAKGGNWQVVA